MSITASQSQHSFLRNSLLTIASTHIPSWNSVPVSVPIPPATTLTISCNHHQSSHHHDSNSRRNENQLAKLAMVTLAAGVLTMGCVDPASAAKSGGRVGGQAFRASPPPSARSSSPRPNTSRTNIYINPPVAPPLGGYGYGYGVPFYGGWGWSPFSFFAPGPSVAVGVGGGFDTLALFLFLGAATAVVRRVFRSREDEDDDY